MHPLIDAAEAQRCIDSLWDESILERLEAFIRIPNQSAAFDPEWQAHGYMEQAVQLVAEWCRARPLEGLSTRVQRLHGRSPLLIIERPGELPGTVLLYGHLDKQPPFNGWLDGLDPWQPVRRGERLYGRGAADDGYAAFSALAALQALRAQHLPLPRCVLLVEASEESGSIDLPAHMAELGESLGEPSLVICLDADCGNYEQLWCTTSLRGNLSGRLRVRVLREGVHSGLATGLAPSALGIAQQLLARLADPVSAMAHVPALEVAVPAERRRQLAAAAHALGPEIAARIPWAPGVQPLSSDPEELLVRGTWGATLVITGADGLPPTATAGNVLLPEVSLKLSLRLPPTCRAREATEAVRATLLADPPQRAQVSLEMDEPASGWNAPPFAPWLDEALQAASRQVFGRDAVHLGSGGTIPFMSMLGERFPRTQFLVTGVLGPGSNAHGPNEFLHLDYARRLTACVALVIAAQARELQSSAGTAGPGQGAAA